MDGLKEYIFGILIVSGAAGLIQTFAPEGGIKKYIKYIISLSVVVTLLAPFAGLLYTLPAKINAALDVADADEYRREDMLSGEETLINYAAAKISENIRSEVMRVFGSDCRVMLELDTEDVSDIKIKKINIFLDGKADRAAVELYISAAMMARTEVINGDG